MKSLTSATLLCTLLSLSAFAASRANLDQETVTRLREEHKRRGKIVEWMADEKPSVEAYTQALHEPALRGNVADYERNVKLSQKYVERARKAAANRQDETAEKYMAVAKAFGELAGANRKAVEAYKANKGDEFVAALESVLPLEAEIQKLTGRKVPRAWCVPSELSIPLPKAGEDGKGGWGEGEDGGKRE
jgi:hypothetical protein